jgi:hypothetical protein
MSQPFSGLRIVHAANYQFDKDGSRFFNPDHKLHQGMVQNGCYVYPFSINDRARMASPLCSKTGGKKAANRALLQTCRNLQPDGLVLGHAQYITRETLRAIREAVPDIRIAFWYVDHVWSPRAIAHIHRRADLFDVICCTSGGPLLAEMARVGCPAAFMPNPVEPSIERGKAFENPEPRYDLIFVGNAPAGGERYEMLRFLQSRLSHLRLGFFGCLGNPPVFGRAKDAVLASGKLALNYNQRNDVPLYSSDRLAQLTGNGLCTLLQSGNGFETLYRESEVAFFGDRDDLIRVISQLTADDIIWREVAAAGWRKAHTSYSARSCAHFMLSVAFRRPEMHQPPWPSALHWAAGDRSAPGGEDAQAAA